MVISGLPPGGTPYAADPSLCRYTAVFRVKARIRVDAFSFSDRTPHGSNSANISQQLSNVTCVSAREFRKIGASKGSVYRSIARGGNFKAVGGSL